MEIPLTPLTRSGDDFLCQFQAMATPCEIRIETRDHELAGRATQAAMAVARRIEAKFSRYREDSVIGRINKAGGQSVTVDKETARLLDFAAQCFEISDGLFDITSGVLRRAWTFDGSASLPEPSRVEALRKLVGWKKVTWRKPYFTLPEGMEVDFGGLAKEYAVDRALAEARMVAGAPMPCPARAPMVSAGMWRSPRWRATRKWPRCWIWRRAASRPAAMRGAICSRMVCAIPISWIRALAGR
jgi:FAD:protein FMN transferase